MPSLLCHVPDQLDGIVTGWTEEEIDQGGKSSGFGGGGFGGFSEDDIYAQLFGQMRGGGGGYQRREYSYF